MKHKTYILSAVFLLLIPNPAFAHGEELAYTVMIGVGLYPFLAFISFFLKISFNRKVLLAAVLSLLSVLASGFICLNLIRFHSSASFITSQIIIAITIWLICALALFFNEKTGKHKA